MPSRAVLVGVILALCLVTEGRLARIEVRWGLNVTRCPQALSTIDDYYQREGVADAFVDEENAGEARKMLIEAQCDVIRTSVSAAPPDGYHNPEQLASAMAQLAERYPDLAMVIDLTSEYGVERTAEGRSIFAIKISDNVASDEAEHNILMVAEHHARELAGPETALHTARSLLDEYSQSAEIEELVDSHQIYIVWSFNPDGLAYVWSTDANWRKNRQPNQGGSVGVDLNRNYPFGWGSPFTCGGSESPSSSSYRGTEAASEPETRTMLAFQAERNFVKVLDLHAYAHDVRQNYAACASLPSEIDMMYADFTNKVASLMRYEPVRSCCTGGEIATAFHDRGSLSLLVEIGTAFQPQFDETTSEIARIWPGILAMFTLPIPCSGVVSDADSGAPLSATITLPTIRFEYGETRRSSESGLFFLWVPSGEHEVVFESPGYFPTSITLSATAEGSHHQIQMRPTVSDSFSES